MQSSFRLTRSAGGRRFRGFVIIAATSLALSGCGETEDIVHYKVTRPEAPKAKVEESGPDRVRILGGIIPASEQSWFFKLMGPVEDLAKHEAAFDALLKSVKLEKSGDRPLTWTLPEGWSEGKSNPARYATLLIGAGDKPLEVTVSRAGGALFDNVARWSGQVRPRAIMPNEIGSITREVQGVNVTIVRVDVSGHGGKNPKMPPFAGKR